MITQNKHNTAPEYCRSRLTAQHFITHFVTDRLYYCYPLLLLLICTEHQTFKSHYNSIPTLRWVNLSFRNHPFSIHWTDVYFLPKCYVKAYFCLHYGIFIYSQRRLSRLRSSGTWRRVVLHPEEKAAASIFRAEHLFGNQDHGFLRNFGTYLKQRLGVTFHKTVTLILFSRVSQNLIPDAWVLPTFFPFNSIDYTFVRSDTAIKIQFILLSYLSL